MHMEDVQTLTPEELLKAIRSSWVDGDSWFGVQLHRVSADAIPSLNTRGENASPARAAAPAAR
jgi:hypothetical protein